LLLAHAGSMLKPGEVRRVLDNCPNLQVELSARDPWRHRANRITDDDGRLLADWRDLIMRYAERFMIGSDPVWPVDRLNPWDEPDSGWQELPRFLDFHRTWLSTLPAAQAAAIRWDNAQRFFRRGGG
jgi:predicted TIM-barrel fold metal-dependent hydrolase